MAREVQSHAAASPATSIARSAKVSRSARHGLSCLALFILREPNFPARFCAGKRSSRKPGDRYGLAIELKIQLAVRSGPSILDKSEYPLRPVAVIDDMQLPAKSGHCHPPGVRIVVA